MHGVCLPFGIGVCLFVMLIWGSGTEVGVGGLKFIVNAT